MFGIISDGWPLWFGFFKFALWLGVYYSNRNKLICINNIFFEQCIPYSNSTGNQFELLLSYLYILILSLPATVLEWQDIPCLKTVLTESTYWHLSTSCSFTIRTPEAKADWRAFSTKWRIQKSSYFHQVHMSNILEPHGKDGIVWC